MWGPPLPGSSLSPVVRREGPSGVLSRDQDSGMESAGRVDIGSSPWIEPQVCSVSQHELIHIKSSPTDAAHPEVACLAVWLLKPTAGALQPPNKPVQSCSRWPDSRARRKKQEEAVSERGTRAYNSGRWGNKRRYEPYVGVYCYYAIYIMSASSCWNEKKSSNYWKRFNTMPSQIKQWFVVCISFII